MKLMPSKASQIGSSESASSAWALLIWLDIFLKSSRANSPSQKSKRLSQAAALIALRSLLTLVKHWAL